MFSDDFIDISQYSDLAQIMFNPRKNKWEVNLFRDGKSVVRKFFIGILDANNYATHYLKEMGELDNLRDKKPSAPQKVKYRRSKHEFVFFSTKRNQWYVKVKGFKGSTSLLVMSISRKKGKIRKSYVQQNS